MIYLTDIVQAPYQFRDKKSHAFIAKTAKIYLLSFIDSFRNFP